MPQSPLQPTDAFAWVQAPGGPALVCRPLERFASHLFTTRHWRLGSQADADAGSWQQVGAAIGVAAGPSIGACCYEVGEDVRAAFDDARWFFAEPRPTARNPSMNGLASIRRARHWFFDGWAATRSQLEAAGVPTDRIHLAELCTA